jgi:hypothetical protein
LRYVCSIMDVTLFVHENQTGDMVEVTFDAFSPSAVFNMTRMFALKLEMEANKKETEERIARLSKITESNEQSPA